MFRETKNIIAESRRDQDQATRMTKVVSENQNAPQNWRAVEASAVIFEPTVQTCLTPSGDRPLEIVESRKTQLQSVEVAQQGASVSSTARHQAGYIQSKRKLFPEIHSMSVEFLFDAKRDGVTRDNRLTNYFRLQS
jgi:hypothetical protein